MDNLSLAVAILVALSVASERLVEIIKGMIPFLANKIEDNPAKERWRKVVLQVLAVGAGIFTAWLAKDVINAAFPNWGFQGIWALGLLASGGSGFWNSIAAYLLKVKDIKGVELNRDITTLRGAQKP